MTNTTNQTEFQLILHSLRCQIDQCISAVSIYKLNRGQVDFEGQERSQREISLAFTKLQEAKMWLGKALEATGSELPVEYQDNWHYEGKALGE